MLLLMIIINLFCFYLSALVTLGSPCKVNNSTGQSQLLTCSGSTVLQSTFVASSSCSGPNTLSVMSSSSCMTSTSNSSSKISCELAAPSNFFFSRGFFPSNTCWGAPLTTDYALVLPQGLSCQSAMSMAGACTVG